MDNEALMKSLVSWAHNEALIDPPVFNCRYYGSCNKSVGDALWRGNGCMMSYVGRQYGSNAIGEGFRLVIVGIDHGAKWGGTFEERRDEVEGYHQNGDVIAFNPHYRGVVKTAAAVFGSTGVYCRDKCTTSCQKSRDPAAFQCVIDRIVQPNSVKCTPENTENATSRATWVMKANCTHHLASELKLLQPGLVVFHGIGARWVVRDKLQDCGLNLEAVESVRDDGGPVLYKSETLDAYVLFLYHPSRGWLNRQWESVVVPALNYLRSRNLIPSQEDVFSGDEYGAEARANRMLGSEEHDMEPGTNDLMTPPAATNVWSDDVKAKTRDVIGNVDILAVRDGQIHFKHITSGFGAIAEDDVLRGVLKLVDRQTGAETTFASADELIAAGWVID